MAEGNCASIVGLSNEILIAAMLERDQPVDWFVRSGLPLPTEETWRQMITKVQILVAMLKNTSGYLGAFSYTEIHNELGTIYLFPIEMQKVLCVVARPQRKSELVGVIQKFVRKSL